MRIFLLSLILCATGLAQSTVGREASLPDLAKAVRPSVMLVKVYDEDGKEISVATGFLVSADGKLVTNHHVIERAVRVAVRAANGGEFHVEGVLGEDQDNDRVVLKIDAHELPFLKMAGESATEVGARVFVIGKANSVELAHRLRLPSTRPAPHPVVSPPLAFTEL